MLYGRIEWDEGNLEHAPIRATVTEIEQVILNAEREIPHESFTDRVLFDSVTNGGRPLIVVAQRVRDGVRPITVLEKL